MSKETKSAGLWVRGLIWWALRAYRKNVQSDKIGEALAQKQSVEELRIVSRHADRSEKALDGILKFTLPIGIGLVLWNLKTGLSCQLGLPILIETLVAIVVLSLIQVHLQMRKTVYAQIRDAANDTIEEKRDKSYQDKLKQLLTELDNRDKYKTVADIEFDKGFDKALQEIRSNLEV